VKNWIMLGLAGALLVVLAMTDDPVETYRQKDLDTTTYLDMKRAEGGALVLRLYTLDNAAPGHPGQTGVFFLRTRGPDKIAYAVTLTHFARSESLDVINPRPIADYR